MRMVRHETRRRFPRLSRNAPATTSGSLSSSAGGSWTRTNAESESISVASWEWCLCMRYSNTGVRDFVYFEGEISEKSINDTDISNLGYERH